MASSQTSISQTSILLVDDNPANLKVLQTLLTAEGYHVRVANSGARALTAAAMSPPQLIMLDIRMPEMDGYEVCNRLKADRATHDIPVIFLSVAKDPIDKVKAFSTGGVDYITKPFDTEEVLARVKTHVTLHRLQQQLKEAKATLEDKVRIRTSELQDRNFQLKEEMAERAKLIEKLESQNAELERFTYTVSHELKTPLITINWVTGSLQEDLAKVAPDSTRKSLEQGMQRVSETSNHMAKLLEDVLVLARTGRVVNPPKDVSFGELVSDALNLLNEHIANSGVAITIGPDLPVVHCDRQRLTEVLENLIENAIRFMGDQSEPHIQIGVRRGKGEYVYYVRDN